MEAVGCFLQHPGGPDTKLLSKLGRSAISIMDFGTRLLNENTSEYSVTRFLNLKSAFSFSGTQLDSAVT